MDERDRTLSRARPDEVDELPPDLRAVARRYAASPTPRPTPEHTTRLIARLLAEAAAAPRASASGDAWLSACTRVALALRVARWRVRLLGAWFWMAGVLLLGLAAALTLTARATTALVPLVVVAPLTVVLSLAHAVRTSSGGLREVEASSPVGFVEVTAGLTLAIVGFDGTLGVLTTGLLALLRWAPFAALLAAWLGPLLLLAGISLPVALRWGALPAAAIGGGPWLLLALLAWAQPHTLSAQLFALPQDALSLWAHVGAALLGALLIGVALARGSAWRALAVPTPL